MNYELEKTIQEELLNARIKNRDDLDCFKRKIAKKYRIPCLKNTALLKIYHELPLKERVKSAKGWTLPILLRKRPVRSLSGVVNVSVLTKPYKCPGKCIFCPSEKGIPKSYLSNEPAVQRAVLNKFKPYKQVMMRLNALQETGHPIDKVELRIIGGTWSYYPKKYQEWFIAECFHACNESYGGLSPVNLKVKAKSSKQQPKAKNLKEEQKKNEKAKCRIVGISVETRPDFIDLKEIKRMRELGITKVELGVQSVYDDILRLNKRGHNVSATIKATKLLKDAGFKVAYQMMPGLLGSDFKKDVAMFREIFNNPDFKPDYLKIYPLALVKNCGLFKYYKQGKYKPYNEKQLLKLLVAAKQTTPYWCRIERIIRDIPSDKILEGASKILNFRELVLKEMREQGLKCKCIRCREIKDNYNPKEKLYLFRENYKASGGCEIFLSFENKKRTKLYALLRLRLPQPRSPKEPSSFRKELGSFLVLKNAVIIRDLHTYGQMAKIYDPQGVVNLTQHKGLGKKLMQEAERIAKERGYQNIAVISGVGVREYYRKLGYKLRNTYMVKNLK